MRNGLFLLVIAVFLAGCQNSQSTLALQEKCAEAAKKFEQDKNSCPFGVSNSIISLQNHYNKKLDKCFVRVGYYLGQEKGMDGENHPSYGVDLYDIFENSKPLGTLNILGFKCINCYIGNKRCKNGDEFEALIKPYMEE